jgi:hypothetical protein
LQQVEKKENMKQIILLLAFTSTLLFSSCEGPEGPPGDSGLNILGQVFETTINFNNGNNFSQIVTFPSNIEVFESDVVLVYLLSDVFDDGSGSTIDVWSQLPQTFFPPQGTLLYTFDHTFLDVKILLDANFNLQLLGPAYTNDQVFRIAIVPSEFGTADLSMRDLLVGLEINTDNIQKID